MQLSPESNAPRISSYEELQDDSIPAHGTVQDQEAAALGSQQALKSATGTTDVPNNDAASISNAEAWMCAQSQETRATSSYGTPPATLQGLITKAFQRDNFQAHIGGKQPVFCESQQDAPAESSSPFPATVRRRLSCDRSARDREASMHTAVKRLRDPNSSSPARSAQQAVSEATYNTQNHPTRECQPLCQEPATPLVARFYPASRFGIPTASEVFGTPGSSCREEGPPQNDSPLSGRSDSDSSPLIPQSTVRRGSQRMIASDDEEQPSKDRSLPFLTAIANFDKTFSPKLPSPGLRCATAF